MKIKLTSLASFKLIKLLAYLEQEWSTKTKLKFLEKMNSKFEILKTTPELFPKSQTRPELRKLVITKQSVALYKVEKDIIYIITIFDSRQNPSEIENEINKHFG
jgi:plasmid stabilization system protein ParE